MLLSLQYLVSSVPEMKDHMHVWEHDCAVRVNPCTQCSGFTSLLHVGIDDKCAFNLVNAVSVTGIVEGTYVC